MAHVTRGTRAVEWRAVLLHVGGLRVTVAACRRQGVKDDDGEVLPQPDTLRGRSLQTIMDKTSGEDMGNPKFKELRPVRRPVAPLVCVPVAATGAANVAQRRCRCDRPYVTRSCARGLRVSCTAGVGRRGRAGDGAGEHAHPDHTPGTPSHSCQVRHRGCAGVIAWAARG